MTPTDRVVAALLATQKFENAYLQSCLEMRAGYQNQGKRLGSWYPMMSPRAILGALLSCEWEEIEHEAIGSPAVGFATKDLGGMVGMVLVNEKHLLKHGEDAHLFLDDAKGTGFLSLVTDKGEAHEAERSVIILGPDKAGEIVWTFHPGAPAPKPSLAVDASRGLVHGKPISVAKAQALGFTWAKLR